MFKGIRRELDVQAVCICELEDVVSKCRTSKSLPDEVIRHIKSATDADADDLKILREILCSGLTGNWPDDETTDSFSALCWFLEVIAENVTKASNSPAHCRWF